jgi:tRNA modification GTPase
VQIVGDVSATLAALGVRPVNTGQVVLREIPGVDTIVVARVSDEHAMLFPHAGPAVMAGVVRALETAGASRAEMLSARDRFPEASSEVEARMLAALARAQSPLAIDLLLDQPRRWAGRSLEDRDAACVIPEANSRRLRRLVDPPLVVALGPPNIGKSSLVNALAGRSVAVVADMPGTTRDHVGVSLDLSGVVVRYVDTAGITADQPSDELDRLSQEAARRIAAEADLVLLCADAGSPAVAAPRGVETLVVGLRSDLGPASGCDLAVSVRRAEGLEALTSAVGERLIPPALRADPRAWVFWDAAAADSGGR